MKVANLSSKLKAAIFDMDGLLIDSEPYWSRADAIFFERRKKKLTREIDRKTLGMGQREVIEYWRHDLGIVGQAETLINERRSLLYEILLENVSLTYGAKAFIQELYKKELTLAIATGGHTVEKVGEMLRKLMIDGYFSEIVSGDNVARNKPAPDIYFKSANLLRVDPSKCLVLEDSPNGVKAGRLAGMIVYGVNKDIRLHRELKESGADRVFRSLAEINL